MDIQGNLKNLFTIYFFFPKNSASKYITRLNHLPSRSTSRSKFPTYSRTPFPAPPHVLYFPVANDVFLRMMSLSGVHVSLIVEGGMKQLTLTLWTE